MRCSGDAQNEPTCLYRGVWVSFRMHQVHSEQGFRDSMLSVSLGRNVTSGGLDKRLRGTRTGQCKTLAQPQQHLKLKSLSPPVYTLVFQA